MRGTGMDRILHPYGDKQSGGRPGVTAVTGKLLEPE